MELCFTALLFEEPTPVGFLPFFVFGGVEDASRLCRFGFLFRLGEIYLVIYWGETRGEPLLGFLVVAEVVLGSLGGRHVVGFVSIPIYLLQRELLVSPEVPLVIIHREDEIGVGAFDGQHVGVGFVPAVEQRGVGDAVVFCVVPQLVEILLFVFDGAVTALYDEHSAYRGWD